MRKLRICADPFPPYQYIDKDGSVKGRDYDLVAERLHQAGYETEVCIAAWNQIYPQFENGDQDVLFQAQDSPERLEKFYLSKKLRDAITEVVTIQEKLKDIQNYSDLENYRLGVIADFANGPEIDELSDSCKVGYADAAGVLKGIYEGEVDFGVLDQGVKEYLMAENIALYPVSALTYYRPLYVMFREKTVRDDFDKTGEEAKEEEI